MGNDFVTELIQNSYLEFIEDMYSKGMSEVEIEEILEKFDISKPFNTIVSKLVKDYVNHFEESMYENILIERAITNEFLIRNEQIWGKGFIASEAMYSIALESVKIYGEYLKNLDDSIKGKIRYTYLALLHIHGRACQMFSEILCLIKSGYADGAFARWRSMYELSVIADFIKKNGEKVAKEFYNASDGNDNWYNWAKVANCFLDFKGNITFSKIQEQCDFVTYDWKLQYNLANKLIHASPQGTFKRIGTFKPTGVISVGQSDYGISTPAEHSAISLSIITSIFLTVIPYGDGIVNAQVLNEWVNVVRKYYFEAKKSFFSEIIE